MPKRQKRAEPVTGNNAYVLIDIAAWLEKRKIDVPSALHAACPKGPRPAAVGGVCKFPLNCTGCPMCTPAPIAAPYAQLKHLTHPAATGVAADQTAEFCWALTLLSDLKERERRALSRHVQRVRETGGLRREAVSSAAGAVVCSDDADDEQSASTPLGAPLVCVLLDSRHVAPRELISHSPLRDPDIHPAP